VEIEREASSSKTTRVEKPRGTEPRALESDSDGISMGVVGSSLLEKGLGSCVKKFDDFILIFKYG
jgi:hypothetical protein